MANKLTVAIAKFQDKRLCLRFLSWCAWTTPLVGILAYIIASWLHLKEIRELHQDKQAALRVVEHLERNQGIMKHEFRESTLDSRSIRFGPFKRQASEKVMLAQIIWISSIFLAFIIATQSQRLKFTALQSKMFRLWLLLDLILLVFPSGIQ